MVKTEYVVYNDGWEMDRFSCEADAKALVAGYDGDHLVWYDAEEVEVEESDEDYSGL